MLFTSAHAQKPELSIPTGHSNYVKSVAFSIDGQLLASGGWDNVIKLWEVRSGRVLRTLVGHSSHIESVAFSPDGRSLASCSSDRTVRIWDLSTGREISTLEVSAESIAFSSDGGILATAGSDSTIKLWEVRTGKLSLVLGGQSSGTDIVFSPDGKTLACSSRDGTVKLWNASLGRELRTLIGHRGGVRSVAFSQNGKMLASGGEDRTIKLWDVESGTELRTLMGHADSINSVTFSSNRTLISGSSDRHAVVWEVETGRILWVLKGHSWNVFSVAHDPTGRLVASSTDKIIKLWDLTTGNELRTFSGYSDVIHSIGVSADGRTMANASETDILIWKPDTGELLRRLMGHSRPVKSLALSNDGGFLASGSYDNTIKFWNTSTGQELQKLLGHTDSVSSLALSADGSTLASGSGTEPVPKDKTIRLWDRSTGGLLGTLVGHRHVVTSVALSPDGQILASGSWDQTIKLWNVSSRTEMRTLKSSGPVFAVHISPDGKTLVSGTDSEVALWDIESGRKLRTLYHSDHGWITSVAFSRDKSMLAAASMDKTIRLWDLTQLNRGPLTLQGHTYDVLSIAFSPDSNYLWSGGRDGAVILWDTTSGSQLATLAATDEHDWLVVTPDGLFDGTAGAWSKLLWRFNNNTFDHAPVEAFFNEYFYPGLLQEMLAGKRPRASSDISQKDRRQIPITLTATEGIDILSPVTSRNLNIQVEVSEAPAGSDLSDKKKQLPRSGARDVRLFRNGSLVKLWSGDVFSLGEKDGCKLQPQTTPQGSRRTICTATVPIVRGPNNFTAYAFNGENIKSEDATLTVMGAGNLKRVGTLYVIAMGVNNYENEAFNLTYAVPDAEDFSVEIKKQQESLRKYERTEIISHINQQATKRQILDSLKKLSGTVQPEDGVIVYFSGHGVAQGDRFYLIPHDIGYMGSRKEVSAEGLRTILTHSISDLELEEAFRGIDAGLMLLVIDACNSGKALQADDWRRGPMNTKGLGQLAYEKGMYVLTASQDAELAYESEALKHSYLTYALIELGLKTKAKDADVNKDGQVFLREWFDFAVGEVPRLRQSRIEQTAKRESKALEEVIVREASRVQQPRVFYRREAELQPFVVARP